MQEMILAPMEIGTILTKIDKAISEVVEKEIDNLERGLHEQNISGCLTVYLKPLFSDYNVDPEYNGDFDKPNDRKALVIAKARIDQIKKQINKNDEYKITPDVIIHKRKHNRNNLVVIEAKKDISNKYEKEFDLIKLEHLTIDYVGNHYSYTLGVAIIFGTGENAGKVNVSYFQNGLPKERNELI